MAIMIGTYTRAHFMELPEGFPAQLVEGFLVREPAPTFGHQRIAGDVHALARRLVGSRRAPMTPVDVLIDELNVYQPDVVVFGTPPADDVKTEDLPVPLLIVEVLSPSTASRDREIKRLRLLEAGVQEVWLIDSETRTIDVYDRGRHRDVPRRGHGEKAVASHVLEGFELTASQLFGAR